MGTYRPHSSSSPMGSPSFARRSLMAGHRLRILQVVVLVANVSCFLLLLSNVVQPSGERTGSAGGGGDWKDVLGLGLFGGGSGSSAFSQGGGGADCTTYVEDLASIQEEHSMLQEEHSLLLERNREQLAIVQSNQVDMAGLKQDCDVCPQDDLFCKAYG